MPPLWWFSCTANETCRSRVRHRCGPSQSIHRSHFGSCLFFDRVGNAQTMVTGGRFGQEPPADGPDGATATAFGHQEVGGRSCRHDGGEVWWRCCTMNRVSRHFISLFSCVSFPKHFREVESRGARAVLVPRIISVINGEVVRLPGILDEGKKEDFRRCCRHLLARSSASLEVVCCSAPTGLLIVSGCSAR